MVSAQAKSVEATGSDMAEISSRVVTFLLVVNLTGVAALGAFLFLTENSFRPPEIGIDPEAAMDSHAGLATSSGRQGEELHFGSIAKENGSVTELGHRLDEVIGVIADLRSQVTALQAESRSYWERSTAKDNPTPAIDFSPMLTSDRITEFESQFEQEKGQSAWGMDVGGRIGNAIHDRVTSKPFFLQHGGGASSDCKQTICQVTWAPDQAAEYDSGELTAVFEMARWEMMELVGQSGISGEVAISVVEREGVPAITVMLKQDAGGDIPESMLKF